MNKPSPLIPQGSLPQGAGKGASNVRIAVVTIIAIHIVFFGGLLMQGCKRDNKKAETATDNTAGALTLPIMTNRETLVDTNPLPVANEVTTNYQTPAGQSNVASLPNTIPAMEPPGGASGGSLNSGQTTEYIIVRNDTLSKIAHAHGTTAGAIVKANPGIDPAKLKIGQKIQVPAASTSNSTIPGVSNSTDVGGVTAQGGSVHVVKAGETLTRIAHQHGTTVKALRAANGLKTDRLVAGQKLKLPARTTATNSGAGSAPAAVIHHSEGR